MKLHFRFLFLFFLLVGNIWLSPFQNLYAQSKYPFYDGEKWQQFEITYQELFVTFDQAISIQDVKSWIKAYPNTFVSPTEEDMHTPNNAVRFRLKKSKYNDVTFMQQLLTKIADRKEVLAVHPALKQDENIVYADNKLLYQCLKSKEAEVNTLLRTFQTKELNREEFVQEGIEKVLVGIEVDKSASTFEIYEQLLKNNLVEDATPNLTFSATSGFTPNDPDRFYQWHLNQNNDADIDAFEAWNITQGSSSVIVAVWDLGFDMSHQDLVGKQIGGYDAVWDDNNPSAGNSYEKHGTPCIGLIAANTNNALGVAGVGYNVMGKPVRIGYAYNNTGQFYTNFFILNRACWNTVNSGNVVAVSNSWGGSFYHLFMQTIFNNTRLNARSNLGTVILAATGNEYAYNATRYPCNLAGVIGVGSSNQNDNRTPTSNYGNYVDVAAPGNTVYSTDRSGSAGTSPDDYDYFGGTSAACPIAAGVVGLIASVAPNASYTYLQNLLMQTCDKVGGYTYANGYPNGSKCAELGYGRVNAFKAVMLASGITCTGQQTLTTCTGTIEDGSANNNYGNNQNCSWLIQPAGATCIALSLDYLSTQAGVDMVKVYNGVNNTAPLLATWSGNIAPTTIIATSGKMYIEFTTNGNTTDAGWAAHYVCNNCGCSNGSTPFTAISGSFDDNSGIANNYLDNTNCTWLIQPPNANCVNINFNHFDTELGNDIIKVYDGVNANAPLLGQFSGTTIPPNLIAQSGAAFIEFITNSNVTKTGWMISYSINNCGCNSLTNLTGLSATFNDGSGVYANYEDYSNCSWHISPGNVNTITLNFNYFDTELCCDWVKVYNGSNNLAPLLATYAGNTLPPSVTYATQHLFIEFHTDQSIQAQGWEIAYTTCSNPPVPVINTNGALTICQGAVLPLLVQTTDCPTCTYSWSNGQTGDSISANTTGSYTVTAYNTCGNSTSLPVSLTVDPLPFTDAGVDKTICSTTAISIGTSALPNMTYIWTPNTALSSDSIAMPLANPMTTTKYYLTVVDKITGCGNTDSVQVIVRVKPTANAGTAKIICEGTSVTLGTTAAANTSYTWSPTTALNNSTISNPSATPSTTTTYTVTAYYPNSNCTNAQANVTVTVKPGPIINYGLDKTICLKDSVQIGGASMPNTTYTWTPTTLSALYVSSPKASPSTTTNYYLTAKNTTNSCTKKDTIKVVVNPLPNAAGVDKTICSGTTTSIGTVAIPNVTYSWFPTSNLNNPTASTTSITNLQNTTYYYYLAKNNLTNCQKVDTVKVAVNPLPIANAGLDKTICKYGSTTIGGSSTTGLVYLWTPSTALSPANTITTLANPVNTTTYTLKVTNPLTNCFKTDAVIVTVNALPTANAGVDKTIAVGASTTLNGVAVNNCTYSWSPALALSNVTVINPIANPSVTTNYSLTVKNNTTGCTNTDVMTVNVLGTKIAFASDEINSPNIFQSIQVFPNPTDKYVWVESEVLTTGTYQFVLVDEIGKTIWEKEITYHNENISFPISMEKYSHGVYFLFINNEKGSISKKIIKN